MYELSVYVQFGLLLAVKEIRQFTLLNSWWKLMLHGVQTDILSLDSNWLRRADDKQN